MVIGRSRTSDIKLFKFLLFITITGIWLPSSNCNDSSSGGSSGSFEDDHERSMKDQRQYRFHHPHVRYTESHATETHELLHEIKKIYLEPKKRIVPYDPLKNENGEGGNQEQMDFLHIKHDQPYIQTSHRLEVLPDKIKVNEVHRVPTKHHMHLTFQIPKVMRNIHRKELPVEHVVQDQVNVPEIKDVWERWKIPKIKQITYSPGGVRLPVAIHEMHLVPKVHQLIEIRKVPVLRRLKRKHHIPNAKNKLKLLLHKKYKKHKIGLRNSRKLH